MFEDPIVEEVRRVRDAHAAHFGYDLDQIVEDLKRLEEKDQASGRVFLTREPRRPQQVLPGRV